MDEKDQAMPKPLLLTILDGWGYSEEPGSNAILGARTPVWDLLWKRCPHTLIRTSGASVGLPGDQMGNSEVGHLNIGAGRVVYQEFTRVSRAIRTGSFFTNQTLTGAVDRAVEQGRAVHIMGLLSPGGVHSHEEHIHAMAELAVRQGAEQVYLHCFLDGRDTPPKSAAASLEALQAKLAELGAGRVSTMIGRYYAMDRDHRWPRIKAAWDLMTRGLAAFEAPDPLTGLHMAYARDETDEFVQATLVVPPGEQPAVIGDGDVVVFMNYRSDRARQITRPFIDPDFDAFEREVVPRLGGFVSLTEYSADFDIPVAFPPERLRNTLGEYLSALGMHQLRIAETEKYAHVTFFFNGGREEPFPDEDRILVPSPAVATYDLQPEMSAVQVTDRLIEAVESGDYDVIVCNFANPDMVGHTGNYAATVQAIEALDACLGRLHAAVSLAGGEMLITADHGNAEKMLDEETGQPHTAHTSNPVPLVYVGRPAELEETGALADLAPTIIHLLGLEPPAEMTGRCLVRLRKD